MNSQSVYATNPWDCVLDNVTGLMWEVKTNNGDLRDSSWRYYFYPVIDGLLSICFSSTDCTVDKYVADVNAVKLCGHNDWRLPNIEELSSIVNSSIPSPGPTIDVNWFPNSQPSGYWSSTFNKARNINWALGFSHGGIVNINAELVWLVRLVREKKIEPIQNY